MDRVPDALLRLVTRYQAERRADEPFRSWARRLPQQELASTITPAPSPVGS